MGDDELRGLDRRITGNYGEDSVPDAGQQRAVEAVGENAVWTYLCDHDRCDDLFSRWLEGQMGIGWTWDNPAGWPAHLRPLLLAFREVMVNDDKHIDAAREAAAMAYKEGTGY